MPPYAFAVTKRITWRGQNQDFSNVYHFDIADPNAFNFANRLLAIRTQEVNVHANTVNFVGGRAWGPTNAGPEASKTMEILDWTNVAGALTQSSSWYKELAFMVFWPLGRYGKRNRPQYLRKWLHTMNNHGIGTGPSEGATQITVAPTALTTYIENIVQLGGLCTHGGRNPTGTGKVYPYLEHRQLGR